MPSAVRRTRLQLLGLACSGCHAPNRDLQQCARCRRAWYCSTTCQRDDFPLHAELCAGLALGVNGAQLQAAAERRVPAQPEDVFASIREEARRLAVALRRCPSAEETDYLWRGQRCAQCLHTPLQLAADTHDESTGFTGCPACLLAQCCSEECWAVYRPLHRTACLRTQAFVLSESIWHSVVVQNGNASVPFFLPGPRVAQQAPLPSSWADYFKSRAAAGAAAPLSKAPTAPATATTNNPTFAHTTDALSKPLVAMRALEQLLSRIDLVQREELTLHILVSDRSHVAMGATSPSDDCRAAEGTVGPWELEQASAWEELLHLLPRLRRLNLVFVGPALVSAAATQRQLAALGQGEDMVGEAVALSAGVGGGSGGSAVLGGGRGAVHTAAGAAQSFNLAGSCASHESGSAGEEEEDGEVGKDGAAVASALVTWIAPVCPDCRHLGCVRRMTLVPCAYEQWVGEGPWEEPEPKGKELDFKQGAAKRRDETRVAPDLVLAFDARFHDPVAFAALWARTLASLLSASVPLCFTSRSPAHAARDVDAIRVVLDGERPQLLPGTSVGAEAPFSSLLWRYAPEEGELSVQLGRAASRSPNRRRAGSSGTTTARGARGTSRSGGVREQVLTASSGTAASGTAAAPSTTRGLLPATLPLSDRPPTSTSQDAAAGHLNQQLLDSPAAAGFHPCFAPEEFFSPTACMTFVRGVERGGGLVR